MLYTRMWLQNYFQDLLLWPHYDYIVAAAIAATTARREAVLWLPCQPGKNKRVCSSYGSSSLLPASLLAYALPTVGSANSVDSVKSKTTGTVSRISKRAPSRNNQDVLQWVTG